MRRSFDVARRLRRQRLADQRSERSTSDGATRALQLPTGKAIALSVIAGPSRGLVYPIEKPRVVLGRADADIVIFHPDTVIDRATFDKPNLPSEGIPYVIVRGTFVVDRSEVVEGVHPGKGIRAENRPGAVR